MPGDALPQTFAVGEGSGAGGAVLVGEVNEIREGVGTRACTGPASRLGILFGAAHGRRVAEQAVQDLRCRVGDAGAQDQQTEGQRSECPGGPVPSARKVQHVAADQRYLCRCRDGPGKAAQGREHRRSIMPVTWMSPPKCAAQEIHEQAGGVQARQESHHRLI